MAATHITEGATLIVPVTDQDLAVEFYAGALGLAKRLDFTYAGGERWVEVASRGAARRSPGSRRCSSSATPTGPRC